MNEKDESHISPKESVKGKSFRTYFDEITNRNYPASCFDLSSQSRKYNDRLNNLSWPYFQAISLIIFTIVFGKSLRTPIIGQNQPVWRKKFYYQTVISHSPENVSEGSIEVTGGLRMIDRR